MTPAKTLYGIGYLTKSAVIVTRNDDYGGHLVERATASLRFDLDTYDEVVLVDFNTPPEKKPIISELPDDITMAPHFKSLVVTLEDCAKLMQLKEERCNNYIYESLARNVGIEAATSDVIVSTNIDCIPPSREILDQIVRQFMPTWRHAVVLERRKAEDTWDEALARAPKVKFQNSSTPTIRWTKSEKLVKTQCAILEHYHPGPSVDFILASVISFVGDFQMGHRQLWETANFRWAKNLTGRNFADSLLVMSWMNEGASISVVNQWATHIEHDHENRPPDNERVEIVIGEGGKFTFAGWNLPV